MESIFGTSSKSGSKSSKPVKLSKLKRKNTLTGHRYPVTPSGTYFSHLSHIHKNNMELKKVSGVALIVDENNTMYYQAPGKRGYIVLPPGFPRAKNNIKPTLAQKTAAIEKARKRWATYLKQDSPYQTGSRDEVFFGIARKTKSGKTKEHLTISAKGRVAYKSATERVLPRHGKSAIAEKRVGVFKKK